MQVENLGRNWAHMKRKICLNMIVRNEAHVIIETLDSVSPLVDYWVIVDTGSDDGTPDLIRKYFSSCGITGEMHSREWTNFGVNRSQAIELCQGKAEYVWVMDADDLLLGKPDFSALDKDSYSLFYGPDFCYWRKQIFRASMPWHYVGAVHEYPECSVSASHARLEGDYYIKSRRLGNRNRDSKKYQRDIDLLNAELRKTPDCHRSSFYLAQSHYDNSDPEQALHWYRKRAAMGGFEEEVFYSKLRIAQCLEKLERPFSEISVAYLDCWESRTSRAEPLCHLSRLCRENERYEAGYMYAQKGLELAYPERDTLFVDASVYRWRLSDELSVNAYHTNRFEESASLCRRLLEQDSTPSEQLDRIRQNLEFSEQQLGKEKSSKVAGHLQDSLSRLLQTQGLTHIVDIGANPIDGTPPYQEMLEQGLCTVTGFEPLETALAELNQLKGPLETYLPYAVADGERHTLHICQAPGMTSLLKPDTKALGSLNLFNEFGTVVSTQNIETRRLDDIEEIEALDFLKIDIQGSELSVFQSGRKKLENCVAIHTEVSFLPLYEQQPLFSEVDRELRSQGFILHSFAAVKRWALSPFLVNGDPRQSLNQLLEADAVYVRDFYNDESMSAEQLKHLCLVMHHCYGSHDLALKCLRVLIKRNVISPAAEQEYLQLL